MLIVVEPRRTPRTAPLGATVAMVLSLDVNVTRLSSEFTTVAEICWTSPMLIAMEVAEEMKMAGFAAGSEGEPASFPAHDSTGKAKTASNTRFDFIRNVITP